MLPNREGLFHAYPVEIGLAETQANRLLQVVIRYRLIEELVRGDWTDCYDEGLEITGYHVLEKRDHTLNQRTIESLQAALGWDGRDPFWLQDSAASLAERPVQVKLGFEEYNGRQDLKVQFLNPHGAKAGGVPKADAELRRSVSNRLGAKFRALVGARPAEASGPASSSAPNTSATTTAPPASSTPARQAPKQATMDQAWTEFVGHCPPDKWDQQATEAEWFRVLAELFPGRQPHELSPADWAVMLAEGPGRIVPF